MAGLDGSFDDFEKFQLYLSSELRNNQGLKGKMKILIFWIKTLNVFKGDFAINPQLESCSNNEIFTVAC